MNRTELKARGKHISMKIVLGMDSVLKMADLIEQSYPHYDLDANDDVEYVNAEYEYYHDMMIVVGGGYKTDPTSLAAAVHDEEFPMAQITQQQNDDEHECAICLLDYSVGEMVRQLPCQHLFHAECLLPWLRKHVTCPMCRKPLRDLEDFVDELKQLMCNIKTLVAQFDQILYLLYVSEYDCNYKANPGSVFVLVNEE